MKIKKLSLCSTYLIRCILNPETSDIVSDIDCSVIVLTSILHQIEHHFVPPPSPALPLGAVAESIERWPGMREIESSVPGGVKPMTYMIDTYHFLAWQSALI